MTHPTDIENPAAAADAGQHLRTELAARARSFAARPGVTSVAVVGAAAAGAFAGWIARRRRHRQQEAG